MIDARTVATKKIREGDYLVGLTSKGEQEALEDFARLVRLWGEAE